jgi:predicted MFS family arabinose efflux permease
LIYARRLGAGVIGLALFILTPASIVLLVDVFGTRLVPRIDARGTLATGTLLFAISSFALGASPIFSPLIAGRALQGLGAGLVLGSALQAAVRLYPDRQHALGSFNAAFLLGAALGAPVGGFVASLAPGTSGYRLTFAICGALALLVALILRVALPPLPPVITAGEATIGFPRLSGPPGSRSALALGMLGDFLRGGVVYTALPLAGQARHFSTVTIGVAVGLLSAVEIVTLRAAGRFLKRVGVVPFLLTALGLGVVVAAGLALVSGSLAFLGGAVLFGVVMAGATLAPPLVIVALSHDDPASGLASYRIASGTGMLVGSTGAGAAVATIGASGVFLLVGAVLLGGLVLAYRTGRQIGSA